MSEETAWLDSESYGSGLPDVISERDKKFVLARWLLLGKASVRRRDGLPPDEEGLCIMLNVSKRQLQEWHGDVEVQAELQRLYGLIWQTKGAEKASQLADLYFESLESDPSAARFRLEFERTGQIGKGGVNVNIQNNNTRNEQHVNFVPSGARDHLLNLFQSHPGVRERLLTIFEKKALAARGSDNLHAGDNGASDISDAVVVRDNGRDRSATD